MSKERGEPVRLQDAIGGLYVRFERYRLKPRTDLCSCCHTDQDERALHLVPMQRMTPEALQGFASDALMTWGDVDDFKHFLPRLLEIVAVDHFPGDYPDIETVVGGLERGGWTAWPTDEVAAVRAFLMAFWADNLGRWPGHRTIESVISAIATAEPDLSAYLAVWQPSGPPSSVFRFGEFLCDNATALALGRPLGSPWLEDLPEREAQVRAWLDDQHGAFADRMRALWAQAEDEDVRAHLEMALAIA